MIVAINDLPDASIHLKRCKNEIIGDVCLNATQYMHPLVADAFPEHSVQAHSSTSVSTQLHAMMHALFLINDTCSNDLPFKSALCINSNTCAFADMICS